MHLIAPDILAEARGLSVGACAGAIAVGLLLWLFGWRWHRFWTVAGITAAGGLYGLFAGQTGGGQAIAIGVLLALSAGLLALELARLLAFAAGGTAAWLAAGTLFPDTPAVGVWVLAGGLAGVLFYRLWTMAVTSLVGTLVVGHSGLVLAGEVTGFDAADWAGRNPIALTVAVGLGSLLGLAVQGAQARRPGERHADTPGRTARRALPAEADDGDELPPDLQDLRDTFRRKAGR
jgi:hypothetical protein